VTVIERGPAIFPKDDPEVAQVLDAVLKRDGLELLTSARALEVKKENGAVLLSVEHGGARRVLSGDQLLVAVGRVPYYAGLNLAAAGIKTDARGYVAVDERLRTNVKNIYACGDVTGQFQFTHMAAYQAGIIIRNVILGLPARTDDSCAAWTTFTRPEAAHTGYTEARARELGLFRQAVTVRLKDIDRALVDDEEEGFVKLVLGRGARLIGATMVGSKAGETIPLASLAIKEKLKARVFADLVFPYPAQAEVFKAASSALVKASLKDWMKALIKKLFLN
jgi:pyruvate/2-oxoglutarate dehydrogenase complex dihydrolipoamide dehydrogenase (E3) component